MDREDEIALTVGALLRLPPLNEADVVAGEAGLGREVGWPVALRVRPPAFEPLSGHELALVSIEALHLLDPSLSLAQLVGRLAEREVAGIVVVGDVDPAAIEQADRARLPLLHLPDTVHFADLLPRISRVIAEQRTKVYQLGLDVQHQLAEVSMAGRGLPGIVARVGELAGRGVVLQEANGDVVVRVGGPRADVASDVLPAIDELRRRLGDAGGARTEPPTATLRCDGAFGLAAPVLVRERVVGFLTLLAGRDDFGEDDHVVLTRGSLVCALELAKQEAVTEAERRLRGDFFDALLGSGAPGESAEALIDRGRHLGYDLQRAYAALAIAPDEPASVDGRSDPAIGRIAREVSEYLAARRAVGLVATRRGAVALFLGAEGSPDPNHARRFAEDLRDYLREPVGISVSIGVGSHHPGVAGLRVAYREAEQAGQIGREFFGPGQVTAYADLGVYRLLYAFRQSGELAAFCDETLAALLDYDARNGTSLVETLEVYFRCDASLHAAAATLFLHRNSLAYRLRRISEITGLDLDNLEDRFRLQLALKGHRLVRGQAPARATRSS